jgi:uncharacterized membrane protein SirB2
MVHQQLAIGSTTGITDWIKNNILGVVILVIGILMIAKAHKKDLGNVATMLACVILGLIVVGLAANGNGESVGSWAAKLIFG